LNLIKIKRLFLSLIICSLFCFSCSHNKISLKETLHKYISEDDKTVYFIVIGQQDCPNCYIGLFQISNFFSENKALINNLVYVFDEENIERYNYFMDNFVKVDLLNDNKILDIALFNAVNKKCSYKGRSIYGWYNLETGAYNCATIRETKTSEEVSQILGY